MESIWHDVRYALRGMRGQPGFALLAVLTLGLGIGATTVMFSVIYHVLLDPFPYRSERVVMMQIREAKNAEVPGGRTFYQGPEFLDYMEQSTVFEEVIGGSYENVTYSTAEGTETFGAALVSGNLFQFLGVAAEVGRTLTPEDSAAGAPAVFVMSHKMWRRYFNLDPAIVGRSFVFNGVPTTLVGIMPARFTKQAADLYKPATITRGSQNYFMFQGRLKPGVEIAQAQTELDGIARRLAKVYPNNYPDQFAVRVVKWVDNVVNQFKQTLFTLAAAVGLLLLIACGNVANMLLARATARSKEMSLRAALGAGRARLVRQLLVESLILALLAMVAGCAFAYLGLGPLVAAIPEGSIPREAQIRLNLPVLLFSLGAATLTTLVFGLVPALQTTRRDHADALKDAGKGSGMGHRGGKLRAGLVVAEVALSMVLLASAGLLMRSFIKMQSVDLGYEPERVLSTRVNFGRGQYADGASRQAYFERVLRRIEGMPGIEAATTAAGQPPFGGPGVEFAIPGKEVAERSQLFLELCNAGYFPTLGLTATRGRLLSDGDVASARNVAVINQTMAQRYFGNENPVGQQVALKGLSADAGAAALLMEIIGVVPDVRNRGLDEPTDPGVYVPFGLTANFGRGFLIRTRAGAAVDLAAIRREIWKEDPAVSVSTAVTMAQLLRENNYATPRFSLVVFSVFAGVGLVLITIGIYSVMAYSVRNRTQEIGVRMALGAAPGDVQRLILKGGLALVGLGAVIGLGISLAVSRVMMSQLREVSPNDPLTLALVIGVVGVTGLVACWIPAWRATRIHPMEALRV